MFATTLLMAGGGRGLLGDRRPAVLARGRRPRRLAGGGRRLARALRAARAQHRDPAHDADQHPQGGRRGHLRGRGRDGRPRLRAGLRAAAALDLAAARGRAPLARHGRGLLRAGRRDRPQRALRQHLPGDQPGVVLPAPQRDPDGRREVRAALRAGRRRRARPLRLGRRRDPRLCGRQRVGDPAPRPGPPVALAVARAAGQPRLRGRRLRHLRPHRAAAAGLPADRRSTHSGLPRAAPTSSASRW